MNERIQPFRDNNTYLKLSVKDREFLQQISDQYRLTFQDIKSLIDMARDFETWGEGSLEDFWSEPYKPGLKGKQLKQFLMNKVKESWEELKNGENDYTGFESSTDNLNAPIKYEHKNDESIILGDCPVASEKTRCCNLQTLDVVHNCGFDCAYCSIQSFFDGNRVYFQNNLKEKLANLKLDPQKKYHIGTGQSSDSLMWGNREGILDLLKDFALKNQNVLLELKTKSKNISWLLENEVPSNMIATWSLNTNTIIKNEEHLTATLEERLDCAAKVAEKGILTGFHFHPIVHYKGWQEDYQFIAREIQKRFTTKQVVLISLGTLTFIKPVIKQIRNRDLKSKILEMPLTDAEGKLSYPREIKTELFSNLYNAFNEQWQKEVFFYLCMEDQKLWQPLFGRSYENNEEFQKHMIESYFQKVQS